MSEWSVRETVGAQDYGNELYTSQGFVLGCPTTMLCGRHMSTGYPTTLLWEPNIDD